MHCFVLLLSLIKLQESVTYIFKLLAFPLKIYLLPDIYVRKKCCTNHFAFLNILYHAPLFKVKLHYTKNTATKINILSFYAYTCNVISYLLSFKIWKFEMHIILCFYLKCILYTVFI